MCVSALKVNRGPGLSADIIPLAAVARCMWLRLDGVGYHQSRNGRGRTQLTDQALQRRKGRLYYR